MPLKDTLSTVFFSKTLEEPQEIPPPPPLSLVDDLFANSSFFSSADQIRRRSWRGRNAGVFWAARY